MDDDPTALDRATGIADDSCQDRCREYLHWFRFETRGLLDHEEAHEVLDMVLNRITADGGLLPTAHEETDRCCGRWYVTASGGNGENTYICTEPVGHTKGGCQE